MAWNYYNPGIGAVGSYQVSGHPWLSGSSLLQGAEVQIEFPFVTKSITVKQSGSTGLLRVHFAPTSSTSATFRNYWELNTEDESVTMNVKCKTVYISNGNQVHPTQYQIFAELTTIDTKMMYALTGSGITE